MFILSQSHYPSPPSLHLLLTNTISPATISSGSQHFTISTSHHRTISPISPPSQVTPHSHPPSSHSTAKALRGWATPSFPRRPSLPNIDFACFLCFWQTALPLSRPRPWVIIFGAQGYLNIWQVIQILRNLGHNNRIFGEIFGRLSRFQGHFGNTSFSQYLIHFNAKKSRADKSKYLSKYLVYHQNSKQSKKTSLNFVWIFGKYFQRKEISPLCPLFSTGRSARWAMGTSPWRKSEAAGW